MNLAHVVALPASETRSVVAGDRIRRPRGLHATFRDNLCTPSPYITLRAAYDVCGGRCEPASTRETLLRVRHPATIHDAEGCPILRMMNLGDFRRHRPIAWMALFAILLVALAPAVSQVAANLRHGGEQGHAHAEAMQADAHAGHGSHAEMHEAPPEDCWSACGYCDLFNHVPALDLPGCGELVAADLPALAIDPGYHVFTDVAQRRSAQPRGPPLPFA